MYIIVLPFTSPNRYKWPISHIFRLDVNVWMTKFRRINIFIHFNVYVYLYLFLLSLSWRISFFFSKKTHLEMLHAEVAAAVVKIRSRAFYFLAKNFFTQPGYFLTVNWTKSIFLTVNWTNFFKIWNGVLNVPAIYVGRKNNLLWIYYLIMI